MKILQTLICAAIFTLAACKENDKLTYQTDDSSLNIWLSNSNTILDSLTYNFEYAAPGRDSIVFNYRVLGYPSIVDRTFELVASGSGLEDLNFEYGTYTIKAGQHQSVFPIYIDKPNNYSKFKDIPGKVTFKLKETTHFKKGVSELSQINIVFKNAISKPNNWDSEPSPYRSLATYFGAYSDKKYSFMIQTLKKHSFRVYLLGTMNIDPNAPDLISSVTAEHYKRLCIAALEEYEKINGPLIDEKGNTVRF